MSGERLDDAGDSGAAERDMPRDEPVRPDAGRAVGFSAGRVIVAVLVVALLAGGGWMLRGQMLGAGEAESRAALQEIGALVVMDSNQQHVFSLNLTMPAVVERFDEAIPHVAGLAYLENLDLSRTPLKDDQLKHVGSLGYLTSLLLNGTEISDAGVAHLGGLKSIQALHVAETNVTGEGLGPIGGLGTLQILNLSGTKISGDLAPLAGLSELKWLLLGDLELSDSALATVGKLPKLSRLSIQGSQASDEGLAELNKALPGIQIDR